MTSASQNAAEPPIFKDISLDLALDDASLQNGIKELLARIFPQRSVTKIGMLSGGVTNRLYKVVMTSAVAATATETNGTAADFKVLVRINGLGTEHIIDREHERRMLLQTNKYGNGPTLYATFANGMVYEFFEGLPLDPQSIRVHAKSIALKLAQFHEMPIQDARGSEESMLVRVAYKYLEEAKQLDFSVKHRDMKQRYESFDLVALGRELDNVIAELQGCDIGFCHNDLLSLNIIYDEQRQAFNFIDFEYCCYNFVAFDIGNHFDEYAGFDLRTDWYPSEEQQREFIRSYLAARSRHANKPPSDEEIEQMRIWVLYSSMLANLYWSIWAIIQAYYSIIDFDYWSYAEARIAWYYRQAEDMKKLRAAAASQ